jgi:predicted DNA-binding transcriptional regulator AlpA
MVELWPSAARALGIGRTTAFGLAKRGEFPVPVRKVGNRYRVARADLLKAVGENDHPIGDTTA